MRYAEDGSIVLEAQLLTEAGALFLKALAAGLPESSEPKPTGFKCHDVSAETSVPRVPIEKRRVDALV